LSSDLARDILNAHAIGRDTVTYQMIVKAIGAAASNNRNNLILTVGVILLVVGMFFIPELIDFQRNVGGSNIAGVEESSSEAGEFAITTAKVSELEIDPSGSPLAEIARMIDRGSISTKNKQEGQSGASGEAGSAGSGEGVDVALSSLSQRALTWETFKSDSVSGALGRARTASMELLKDVPTDDDATRFALYNYANGIKVVRDGGEPGMTPEMAYSYLESLDASVTRAMVREGVAREFYKRWQAISLGELFSSSRLARAKQQFEVVFNPGLSLERARVFMPGATFRTNGKVYVNLEGYVRGNDVKRIAAYQDGVFKRNLTLYNPDKDGIRRFGWFGRNARSVLTLVAFDRYGESYEKSYRFFPSAQRFRWTPRDQGTFLINFRSGLVDPSLDRYFRFRGANSGDVDAASNLGFVRF